MDFNRPQRKTFLDALKTEIDRLAGPLLPDETAGSWTKFCLSSKPITVLKSSECPLRHAERGEDHGLLFHSHSNGPLPLWPNAWEVRCGVRDFDQRSIAAVVHIVRNEAIQLALRPYGIHPDQICIQLIGFVDLAWSHDFEAVVAVLIAALTTEQE